MERKKFPGFWWLEVPSSAGLEPPLLKLKYHDSLTDAWKELGKPAEVGKIFVGFQKYLYQTQVGVSPGGNG